MLNVLAKAFLGLQARNKQQVPNVSFLETSRKQSWQEVFRQPHFRTKKITESVMDRRWVNKWQSCVFYRIGSNQQTSLYYLLQHWKNVIFLNCYERLLQCSAVLCSGTWLLVLVQIRVWFFPSAWTWTPYLWPRTCLCPSDWGWTPYLLPLTSLSPSAWGWAPHLVYQHLTWTRVGHVHNI